MFALENVQLHLKLGELAFRSSALVLAHGQNDGDGGQQGAASASCHNNYDPLRGAVRNVGPELLILESAEFKLKIANGHLEKHREHSLTSSPDGHATLNYLIIETESADLRLSHSTTRKLNFWTLFNALFILQWFLRVKIYRVNKAVDSS
jgi:hypothetical protein